MGVPPPIVAVLALAVIWLCLSAVSAADCRDTNCLFEVRDECQTSERVACNLQKGPNGPSKQVNLTRTSFPRNARLITLSHTDTMTVEAGAIAELNSLEHIELTDISTLTLLPHSLQCGNHTGPIEVNIRRVESLRLHPEASSGCDIAFFNIEDVADCQIDSFALAYVRITTMDLRRIDSLAMEGSAIGDTNIEKLSIKQIVSLSLAEGALSAGGTVRELTLDSITHMVFNAGAIQANVSSLTVTNVSMSTCEEHAFGTGIQSLSLTSVHINLTRKGCISSPGQAEKLTVSNSTFNLIEAEAIRGNIKQVRFKRSKFGRFAHQALNLTVMQLSIKDSEIDEITGEALEVLAKQTILLRKCKINHLKMHAFYWMDAEGVDGIRIEEVHISHPEKNSIQFHSHSTRIIPWELELDVPCTCDALNDLNIHALTCKKQECREDRVHWLKQTRCQANGTWPLLGHFIRESCPEPALTTPPVSSEQPSDLHARAEEDQQTTRTAGADITLVIGCLIAALIITIAVVALLVWRIKQWKRPRRRSRPSIRFIGPGDGSVGRQISESSQHGLLDQHDSGVPSSAAASASYPMEQLQHASVQQAPANSGVLVPHRPAETLDYDHPNVGRQISESAQGGLPDERDSRAASSAAASGSYQMADLQHAPAYHAPGNRGVLVPHQPAATLDYDFDAPAAYSAEPAAGAAAAAIRSPTRSPPASPWGHGRYLQLAPLPGPAQPRKSSGGYVLLMKEPPPQSAGTSRASSVGRRRPHNDDWLLPGMPMNREKDPRIRELAYTRRT